MTRTASRTGIDVVPEAAPPLEPARLVSVGPGGALVAARPNLRYVAGELALDAPTLQGWDDCGIAYGILVDRVDLPGIAVLKGDGTIIGFIDRITLLSQFSLPVRRDLYEHRPLSLLMDPDPLMVDAESALDEISVRIAIEKPKALTAGFVVTTDQGKRYLGVGTALDLMRGSVAQARSRADDLEKARRGAEEASRAKSAFLANMSHELRTPLNGIIGFAELIGSGVIAADRTPEYAKDILSSGQHLLRLINDLLDIAKAEAGRLDLREEIFDLHEFAHHVARLLQVRADAAGVGLSVDMPAHDAGQLLVRADETRLRQILDNLIGNAIKFTPKNGAVRVALARVPEGVEIAVRDNGIGIAPADIPRMLEPFTQVDNHLARRREGTGLGLALARQFTELHGGTLTVESALGNGTTVRVRLPADRLIDVATVQNARARNG
ncbi:MAG: pleC [Rhodospirillales bacterium]|nr:pleC [Rhodospirillales bacterium]